MDLEKKGEVLVVEAPLVGDEVVGRADLDELILGDLVSADPQRGGIEVTHEDESAGLVAAEVRAEGGIWEADLVFATWSKIDARQKG